MTTVDDYREVWVDDKMPYTVGQNGGTFDTGYNVPNRVELPEARAGKTYQVAIFGINGPISVAPINRILLRDATSRSPTEARCRPAAGLAKIGPSG